MRDGRRRVTAGARLRVAAAQGWRCNACRKPLPAAFHVDHAVPRARTLAGADDERGLQALCAQCHADKTQAEAAALAAPGHPWRWRCFTCGAVVCTLFPHRCPGACA